MHQGVLKREGRVDELSKQYQCSLEQMFLKVIESDHQS
jgi:Mor family transcriptional regulator